MTATKTKRFDRTGEREPLFADAQITAAQVQGGDDGSQGDILPESVVMKVISVMTCFGSVGVYTASIGALIPLLEVYYDIEDATIGWVFVVNVVGYLLGAALLDRIHLFAGRRGVALSTACLHVLGVAILATKPLYPIVLLAYFFFGIGTGCADAGFCAWAANVRDADAVQGLIHGSFSVGCVIGPMIVAALQKAGFEWNMFYMVMLGTFGTEFFVLLFAFRHDDGPKYRATRHHKFEAEVTLSDSKRPVIYCGLFFLFYVGIETSLSAWLVTFMSRSRNSSTYIAALTSSVFWGGMAIGRFTLGPLARAAGLRLIVAIYILLSLAAQILFRYCFHVALSLILAAGIGFSFGPMFPAGVLMLTSQLPTSLQVRGCSVAASIGQLGGAGAPFILGLVAQSLGIERLLDLVLIMSAVLLLIWLGFSNTPSKLTKPSELDNPE